MLLPAGHHELGPDNGSLHVKTYREGVAAKVGHDLVIEVTRWSATVDAGDDTAIRLDADARSLQVREGVRGVKPLSDKDRADIAKTIDAKVLGGQPVEFRSTAVRSAGDRLEIDGELTLAGNTRPVSAALDIGAGGRVSGTIPLTQTEWGIKPYRGLMGALKVRDDVEIVIDAQLGSG